LNVGRVWSWRVNRCISSQGAIAGVAIGTDSSGRIVLAATEGVLSLAEWAQWLARPQTAGGAGLSDALNLDGGSSTMLALVDGATAVSVRSALQVPVGIAVLPRPASNTTL
jgi:exopolysaccharide biosynthesis protein